MEYSNTCPKYNQKPMLKANRAQFQTTGLIIQIPNNSFDNQKQRVVQDKGSSYNFEVSSLRKFELLPKVANCYFTENRHLFLSNDINL